MPDDPAPPEQPLTPASEGDDPAPVTDPETARDDAALARPIRPWFWPVAVLVALAVVVLVPFYDASNQEGLSGVKGGGPGGNLMGDTYMPVLPLLLLGFFILLWNPLWRWLARRGEPAGTAAEPGLLRRLIMAGTFRIRARELLMLLVLLYVVVSVSKIQHLKSLFVMDDLVKKATKNDTYTALYDNYNRSLSLPSLKGAQGGKSYDAMARKLELEHPEKPNAAGALLVKGIQERNRATLRDFNEAEVRFDQLSSTELAKMKWDSLNQPLAPAGGQDGPVEANGGGAADSPLDVFLGPAAITSILLICAAALVLGLTAMTARQWAHHERLQYPLTQVPMTLVKPSILRSRGFQVALGAVLFITFYNFGSGRGWHPLPQIPVGEDIGHEVVLMKELWKLFGLRMPSAARWVYETWWGALRLSPMAIGLAFLIPLDLGFSLWGGFFFGAMVFGWLYAAGIDVNFQHHARSVGGGATMAMAAVILWIGRHHYLRLLKAAIGIRSGAPADRAGVWGVRVLLVGGAVLCGLLMLLMHGLDPWSPASYGTALSAMGLKGFFSAGAAALLSTLIFLGFVLVIARIIAETGMANMQLPLHLTETMYVVGLPYLFPVHVMALMSWLGATIAFDTRTNAAGYLVQATVMGEQAGVAKRKLFPAFGGLMAATIVIGIVVALVAMWVVPGDPVNQNPVQSGFGGDNMTRLYENAAGPNLESTNVFMEMARSRGEGFLKGVYTFFGNLTCADNLPKFNAFIVGVLLIFGCYGMRRIWVNFPLNPLGIVLAASWPMHQLWGSVLLGWLAKKLVLHYGGSQLYARIKPVAIGLIFGHILGLGLTVVIRALIYYF